MKKKIIILLIIIIIILLILAIFYFRQRNMEINANYTGTINNENLDNTLTNTVNTTQSNNNIEVDGKVKAIGLSNFEGEPLEKILSICEIKPTVIQVETHPYYPQNELKERINKENIHIQAWYPLGHGDKGLIEEPVFTKLAQKYGKSNTQIILRWHIQQENIIIPGSKNPEHIKENANIFDFELTDEEMKEIAEINKNKRYYIPNPELTASYAKMELNPEADV